MTSRRPSPARCLNCAVLTVLALVVSGLVASPAWAQIEGTWGTITIYFDNGGRLESEGMTTDQPFDLVVVLNTVDGGPEGSMGGPQESSAAEFVITELANTVPGLFKLATKKINDTQLDLGDNSLGEYLMAFVGCVPPDDRLELVRISYLDSASAIGTFVELKVRGFEPGDTQLSSFNNRTGYVDCDEHRILMTPGPSLILNPSRVEEEASMGEVKSRY